MGHDQGKAGGLPTVFTDRTVREVILICMSRDLGFSLKYLSEYVPLYRAGTLTFDQMVDDMLRRNCRSGSANRCAPGVAQKN